MLHDKSRILSLGSVDVYLVCSELDSTDLVTSALVFLIRFLSIYNSYTFLNYRMISMFSMWFSSKLSILMLAFNKTALRMSELHMFNPAS